MVRNPAGSIDFVLVTRGFKKDVAQRSPLSEQSSFDLLPLNHYLDNSLSSEYFFHKHLLGHMVIVVVLDAYL